MEQLWQNIINFHTNYPTITGIILGFFPSVMAGHYANRYTSRRDRKNLRAKQKKFIDELSGSMRSYLNTGPASDNEVSERRDNVALKVKELSKKIFNEDYPTVESIRPEATEYPKIDCKWCHRPHKAFSGPRGDCRNCNLPLDLWIGSQGKPDNVNTT